MIESVSIDFSLSNLWRSWYAFRKGKRPSREINHFEYYLEQNLHELSDDLLLGRYKPRSYHTFIVADNKRREISVAAVRDRVVHRLLYDYLVPIYDKTFIFDAWSCRENKGLMRAIARTQKFMIRLHKSTVWRSDVTKFFNSIDHDVLIGLLRRRVKCPEALSLLENMIRSYSHAGYVENARGGRFFGIPIGNLTSQIFANIYLNEFDRFVSHTLKPQAYLRYGDDFLIFMAEKATAETARVESIKFLNEVLKLKINSKNDIIVPTRRGLYFLGVEIFPKGRRLKNRNLQRARSRLDIKNMASYRGLIRKHSKGKLTEFDWTILNTLDSL